MEHITFAVRFVHKISPRATDVDNVTLVLSDFKDAKALGAALRKGKMLVKGQKVREFRIEPSGRVVVFPEASIWHSLILTRATSDEGEVA